MMHVVYSHHIFLEQKVGGVSRYCYELATRVAQDPAFDVAIVAPLYVNDYLRQAPRGLVRGLPLSYPEFRGAWRLRGIVKAIQNRALSRAYDRYSADIMHETYYSSAAYGRAKRRVITVHDMIHELFPDRFGAAGQSPVYAAKRAAIRRADHIICVSEATRRDLLRLIDVDVAKTSVIYHGQSLSTESGPACALPGGKPFLLYVGSRRGYKNFDALCKAYAASPHLLQRVDLVAFGGGRFATDEQQRLVELGIQGRVHYAGGADDHLAPYYRGALAFVYPSLYEGFGLPPLEAMALGCPVVCSNISSIPEVVGDAGLYVDPIDVDDIRRALENIVEDDALRRRLAVAGVQRAAAFSWDRCAQQHMDVYRRLA